MTKFKNDHQRLEARSLEFHQAIASKLLLRPELLAHARVNILRWRERNGAERWMMEWLDILDRPIEEVVRFLCDPSEEAIRLRQSSPFTGILSEQERTEISARYIRTRL